MRENLLCLMQSIAVLILKQAKSVKSLAEENILHATLNYINLNRADILPILPDFLLLKQINMMLSEKKILRNVLRNLLILKMNVSSRTAPIPAKRAVRS